MEMITEIKRILRKKGFIEMNERDKATFFSRYFIFEDDYTKGEAFFLDSISYGFVIDIPERNPWHNDYIRVMFKSNSQMDDRTTYMFPITCTPEEISDEIIYLSMNRARYPSTGILHIKARGITIRMSDAITEMIKEITDEYSPLGSEFDWEFIYTWIMDPAKGTLTKYFTIHIPGGQNFIIGQIYTPARSEGDFVGAWTVDNSSWYLTKGDIWYGEASLVSMENNIEDYLLRSMYDTAD